MDKPETQIEEVKLYKIRWFMLLLFMLTCVVSLMQSIQYSIISDVVTRYYNVSFEAANWTYTIYLLVYAVFIFPGNAILEKYGLRLAITLGSLGTCLGAWIKVLSVAPDRFWVLMLGQAVVGIFEIFLLGTSSHVAAEWFGCNEVSTACSIGAAGIQIGSALGFVLTPIIVKSAGSLIDIESDLWFMAIGVALLCTINLMSILLCFRGKPVSPPSQARLLKNKEKSVSLLKTLKKLFSNRSFVVLAIAYGFDVGITYTMFTLLNEIVLSRFDDAFEEAGRIGLILVLAGTVGSFPFGIVLDKFKLYKGTFLFLQLSCIGAIVLFTFSLMNSILSVHLATALLGFFTTGIIPIGFEVAAEITYPVPEGTSSGILNLFAQIIGIILTYTYSYLFYNAGVIYANLAFAVIYLLNFIMSIFVPFDLKRQKANSTITTNDKVYIIV